MADFMANLALKMARKQWSHFIPTITHIRSAILRLCRLYSWTSVIGLEMDRTAIVASSSGV